MAPTMAPTTGTATWIYRNVYFSSGSRMNAESARLRRKPIAITTVIAAPLNTAFSWAETLSTKGVEMRTLASTILLTVICLSSTPAFAEFVLVRDGAPAATIVIAAEHYPVSGPQQGEEDKRPWSTRNVQDAVREFRHYIEKISGARLPIVSDRDEVDGTLVLIGRSTLTDAVPGPDIPSGRTRTLEEEGFVIQSTADRPVLAGNDMKPFRGTRYAVCEFLRSLGVRWFMPGEFGEVVPKRETLAVREMNVRDAPDFPIRDYWTHSKGTMHAERTEWKIHNLMNPGIAAWHGIPGDSSVRNVLPKDQIDAHPEWFALLANGERNPHMPCMTDPGIIEAVAETLKVRARRGAHAAAFAPDDGTPRCYCEDCRAISTGFDGYGANLRDPGPEQSTSNEWFHFVTRVMENVNGEFPDFIITTNGYSNRDIPPEQSDVNRSGNLSVMFANISACTIHNYDDEHCWQMTRQAQMVSRWCRTSDMVWRYAYNYTMLVGKDTLTPMMHRERVDIPHLHEWGLWGFFDQDEPDWSMTGIPTRILRARLEWGTGTDVDAFLDDFYVNWYGRAAEPVKTFYEALDHAFAVSHEHGHEDVILPQIYTDELLAKLGRSIREAEQLAETDVEELHVEMDALMYEHLQLYVAFQRSQQSCDYDDAIRHADRMIEIRKALHEITPFMGWRAYPVYDAAWRQKEILKIQQRTSGPDGDLLVVMPETARFRIDPHDDGIFARWMNPEWDDSDWRPMKTTAGWQSQGLRDQRGHTYMGHAWYRFDVDIPETDRPVALYAPAIVNEAWLWVNGEYIGHRAYQQPWYRPQPFEADVTQGIKPGETNQITLRVLCNYENFGANGIYKRMFLYARR